MPQKVKGYFYHISQELSPKDHILSPRGDGCNRDPDEPDIPRVCVCPTIAGCLNAVAPSLSFMKRVRVFRTKRKVTTVVPFGSHSSGLGKAVLDSHITKEKWLLHKASFKFIGYINLNHIGHLLCYNPGDPDNMGKQHRCMQGLLELEKEGQLLKF